MAIGPDLAELVTRWQALAQATRDKVKSLNNCAGCSASRPGDQG
jgi:hypothetical protein